MIQKFHTNSKSGKLPGLPLRSPKPLEPTTPFPYEITGSQPKKHINNLTNTNFYCCYLIIIKKRNLYIASSVPSFTMIVGEEFLKQIKEFGLNSYEAKIWAALLSRGVSTAGELSDIANVPRSRSYDILESLEKKGFIVMKIGKPIKYIAVPPAEVVERVKKNVLAEADERANSIEKLKGSDILNELNLLHSKGVDLVDPTEVTGALKGQDNIHDQVNLMLKSAEESVVLVTTETGLARKMAVLGRAFKKAAVRGVKIEVAAPLTEKNKDAVEKLSEFATVRNLEGLNSRFCIADGKEVLFMLMDDSDVHAMYDVGVWINTPYFAQALSQLFDKVWKTLKV